MGVLIEKEKADWNHFVIENNGSFLQSWEWGEFQKSLGRKIWRLSGSDEWVAMIVRYNLPLGKSYLYCPGGPIIDLRLKNYDLRIKEFLDGICEISKREKAIFLKIEPFIEINTGENGSPRYWTDLGFIKSDGGQRIKKTLVLGLAKSEEELLAEMKQKTRYNIKVAGKHGVRVRISDRPEKDFEEFWRLMRETAKRDKIKSHPKDYYFKQLSLFGGNRDGAMEMKLFLAEHQNKIVAANMVIFFGNKAIYSHGASDHENRHLMAPYFLQREQVKEAKKRGCAQYDFWGIDEEKWPGVTRFKRGFGGKEVDYAGAWDYVFQPTWYKLYKFVRKLR